MTLKSFTYGFIAGAVSAGVAVALSTPKRGDELRRDIAREAEDMYKEGKKIADEKYAVAQDKYNEMKSKATETYNTQKEKFSKASKEVTDSLDDAIEEINS